MRLHLQVDITHRSALVVGAGRAGTEKIRRLIASGARVTVVDPAVRRELMADGVDVLARPFQSGDVRHRWLVVAAADSDEVNDAVEAAATAAGVWVTRADRPDGGRVAFAASLERGRVEVAVSTGGSSPTLARWVRERIDEAIPPEVGVVADLLAEARREDHPRGHRAVSIDALVDAVRAGDLDRARQLVSGAG